MKFITIVFIFVSPFCFSQVKLQTGIWRGVLLLNAEKGTELPFNFEVKYSQLNNLQLVIYNAQERIVVAECSVITDSLNFKMPVFDTEFKTKITSAGALTGVWINHNKKGNNTIPFMAVAGDTRRFSSVSDKDDTFFEGKWEVSFSAATSDSSKAIGLFRNADGGGKVYGTFLTETGDYRYLEGMAHNGKLSLSCFDGSHAFLFTAENNGSQIVNGHFYSGSSWHESWEAKRNEKFVLHDPESLTYVKNPNEEINFSFYNLHDEKISLSDAKYKNKVVIIQIMGSWCPNCMDESAYLAKLYKRYNKKGLEIIALAYERTTDTERAKTNLIRFSKRFDIGYDILLTGVSGKDNALESLPFLNKVMAFPTTIYLDSNHLVKSIYTGFNGPATGKLYEDYTLKTEKLIEELLSK